MAAPPVARQTPSEWRDEFTERLNNGDKSREQGLLVAVKGSSLAGIEAACMSQSWNRCLTARYAIKRLPAIGTLLAGVVEDLKRLTEGEPPFAKLTARDEAAWPEYARRVPPLPALPGRALTLVQARDLFRSLGGEGEDPEHPLATGDRLVLLAELADEAFDLAEWELARDHVFDALPERVVVVIADPRGRLKLPSHPGDRRYLSMEVPTLVQTEVERGDESRTYRPGALASDVPAAEDQLGLERHFTALARLLLHHETGRLTLAVEGDWGTGKSSFMLFLENHMVETVLARRGPLRFVTETKQTLQAAKDEHDDLGLKREQAMRAERASDLAPDEFERRTRARQDVTRKLERSAAIVSRREAELRDAKRRAVRDDLVVLHFNPWGYLETGQIWAGLAHRLTSELRDMLSGRERLALRLRYARERKAAELTAAIGTVLVAAVLAVVAATQGVMLSSSGSGGIVYAGGLVLLALVFWRAASGTKPVVDWISERFRPRDHAGGMGYQHEVIQDLRFFAGGVRRGREQCRMVVFIDDLDRCSDTQILEFMGAINLVLVSSGFYVVMGIDTRMITEAVRSQYAGREVDGSDEDIGESRICGRSSRSRTGCRRRIRRCAMARCESCSAPPRSGSSRSAGASRHRRTKRETREHSRWRWTRRTSAARATPPIRRSMNSRSRTRRTSSRRSSTFRRCCPRIRASSSVWSTSTGWRSCCCKRMRWRGRQSSSACAPCGSWCASAGREPYATCSLGSGPTPETND